MLGLCLPLLCVSPCVLVSDVICLGRRLGRRLGRDWLEADICSQVRNSCLILDVALMIDHKHHPVKTGTGELSSF